MTVNVQFATVADSIASISISGVTVKDIDNVPENAMDYCPVLYPIPNGFITDLQPEILSLGGDTGRKLNLSYTLNYRYLHAPIGSGSVLANYAGIITNLMLILEAIMSTSSPSGAVDMEIQGVSDLGPVSDPAEAAVYHGVDIAVRILEYVQ